MAILKIRNENGEFINIPSIVGAKGEPGKDGTLTFEELTEEQKASLKGDKGDTGADGKDGANGVDGYTPVRGTDFWTEEDIKAMELHCEDYIDSQLGTINEQLASLTEVE